MNTDNKQLREQLADWREQYKDAITTTAGTAWEQEENIAEVENRLVELVQAHLSEVERLGRIDELKKVADISTEIEEHPYTRTRLATLRATGGQDGAP